MNAFLQRILRIQPRLSRRDLWITPLLGLLWWGAVMARPVFLSPRCATEPQRCSPESVWEGDRLALGLGVPRADPLSYATQNLSGLWALGAPVLWTGVQISLGSTPLGLGALALQLAAQEVCVVQTAFFNGMLTELSHLISGRARPFVYTDPQQAALFSNYTSFYSGHTSFAAASTTSTVIYFLSQSGPGASLGVVLSSGVAITLTLWTGLYRVLAGRHFPTDVAMGALMGFWVAWSVAWMKRKKQKP